MSELREIGNALLLQAALDESVNERLESLRDYANKLDAAIIEITDEAFADWSGLIGEFDALERLALLGMWLKMNPPRSNYRARAR